MYDLISFYLKELSSEVRFRTDGKRLLSDRPYVNLEEFFNNRTF